MIIQPPSVLMVIILFLIFPSPTRRRDDVRAIMVASVDKSNGTLTVARWAVIAVYGMCVGIHAALGAKVRRVKTSRDYHAFVDFPMDVFEYRLHITCNSVVWV